MAIIHDYAEESTAIEAVDLPIESLLCVGRIIRAVAEIEDIVTVYLSALAKLSEGHAVILFGREGYAKKVDLARKFATAHGQEKLDEFKLNLENDAIRNVIEMRNVLAHGSFLGRAGDGRWAFQTVRQLEFRSTEVVVEAITFGDLDFEHCATTSEKLVEILETELRVKGARQRRQRGALGRHTKARTPGRAKSSVQGA